VNKINSSSNETVVVEDEIDLSAAIAAIWRHRLAIAVCALLFALCGFLLDKFLPVQYEATLIALPVSEKENSLLRGLGAEVGGIASIASLNLDTGANRSTLTLVRLQSQDFLSHFIDRHNLTEILLAAKKWDNEKMAWVINDKIYDSEKKIWKKKFIYSKEFMAYKKLRSMISTNLDPKKNTLSISLKTRSPVASHDWLIDLVKEINESIRSADVEDSNKKIQYLNKQLESINVSEIRQSIFKLLENEQKRKMLASTSAEYAVKTIDPPSMPEEPTFLRRKAIFTASGAALGALIALILIYADGIYRKFKKTSSPST